MSSIMPTLYLRKEKRQHNDMKEVFQSCVAYYTDSGARRLVGVNPYSDRPTRRNKTVMFNCVNHRVIWLDDDLTERKLPDTGLAYGARVNLLVDVPLEHGTLPKGTVGVVVRNDHAPLYTWENQHFRYEVEFDFNGAVHRIPLKAHEIQI